MEGFSVTKFGSWMEAKEICGSMVEKFKLASERAVMQEAQFMRGEVVKYMREGGLLPLSPKTLAMRAIAGFGGSKPLIRNADYRNSILVKPIEGGAFVGVLRTAKSKQGKSVANIAELNEFGGTVVVPITLKSRRFYHAAMKRAGLDSGGGGSHRGGSGPVIVIVKIPARPIFGPVWEKHGKPDLVRARFFARLQTIFSASGGG